METGNEEEGEGKGDAGSRVGMAGVDRGPLKSAFLKRIPCHVTATGDLRSRTNQVIAAASTANASITAKAD